VCGFAGFFSKQQFDQPAEQILRRMSDAIRRRGPDDDGQWWHAGAGVGLTHRRLAIVDLSAAGHQPMLSGSGRFALVYNGEVYNHLALRDELTAAGAAPAWRGHSDTETLLAGFEHWGVAGTLQRAIGMFALAVFDQTTQQLLLARDRMGEKPLYYGWQQGSFLFGSELKSLEQHPSFEFKLDRAALVLYLRHNYIPAPQSVYQHINKLPPATLLTLDLASGRSSTVLYWDIYQIAREPQQHTDPVEATSALDNLLKDAVRQQMVADVPLGAFLSGGVDSSTVVALMQAQSNRQVKTYAIGFEDPRYNEAEFAAAVAKHLGTEHTEWILTGQDALAAVPGLSDLYDEPFADSSQLPTSLVCQLARQQVTVALSGDAGDELFNGYERYQIALQVEQKFAKTPAWFNQLAGRGLSALPASVLQQIGRVSSAVLPKRLQSEDMAKRLQRLGSLLQQPDLQHLYLGLISHHPAPHQLLQQAAPVIAPLTLLNWDITEQDKQSRFAYLDLQTYLPDDILVKTDRAAMAVSLEGRVPLLDHRVVEFALRLPAELKYRDGKTKWLLRQVLYQYVPAALIERPKRGFAVPVADWLRGPLVQWADALLCPQRLASQGLFNTELVSNMWQQHRSGQRDAGYLLWNVLMLQDWLAARPQVRF